MGIMAKNGYYFEDLEVGMKATYATVVTEDAIRDFAEISGDKNPVHLDEEYASSTVFKERIAHGILTASYISAVIGMELPGPGCIYVSQSLNFMAPVMIGAEVVAEVQVEELFEVKRRAILGCSVTVGDKVVLEGEAVVMVPKRPEE